MTFFQFKSTTTSHYQLAIIFNLYNPFSLFTPPSWSYLLVFKQCLWSCSSHTSLT